MGQIYLLKGSHDLIDILLGCFDSSGYDFSGQWVIFPGKRPPHFLNKRLAEIKGRPIIPPVSFSIDLFVEWIYRNQLKRRTTELEPCDAVSILHDLYLANCSSRLDQDLSGSFDRFMPVGFCLLSALEELCIENIPWDIRFGSFTIEPQILQFLYRPFYATLAKHNLHTRALMFRDTAAQIQDISLPCQQIIFSGFFSLTESETIILKHFLQKEHCRLYLQEGPGIDWLIQKFNMPHEIIEFPLREAKVTLYQGANAHEEIFMLNEVFRETGKDNLVNEKNVIVLPAQENLFPLLRNGLPDFSDEEINISLGYPLFRTPASSFLNTLLHTVNRRQNGKLYAPDYLSVILHPYAKNTKTKNERTDITRILCHTLEEVYFSQRGRQYFQLEELESDTVVLSEVVKRLKNMETDMTLEALGQLLKKIHDHTLRPFFEIKNIQDFADKCLQVLAYLNNETTAPRHPFFNTFIVALVTAMETMKGTFAGTKAFSDPESYQRLLYYYLRTEQISFPGTPVKGLQILGLLETRNLSFDRVFILDVNEDILPPSIATNPFLPPVVRQILELNPPDHNQRVAGYAFHQLMQNAKEVHLFYISTHDMIRSRYIEQYVWKKQKAEEKIDIENTLIRKGIGTFRLSRSLPEPIEKNELILQRLNAIDYSPSMLRSYLDCGLKFYYQYMLRLTEKDQPDDTVDAAGIGTVVHQILREYFSGLSLVTVNTLSVDKLKRIIGEQFVRFFGSIESGRLRLIANQVERRLTEFLEHYQKNIASEILELEAEKKALYLGYNLKGRIDRIEKRNGKYYILDYKTSGTINLQTALDNYKEDNEKFKTLIQLIVYWIVFSAQGIPYQDIVPAYLFLGGDHISHDCEVGLKPEHFEGCRDRLKNLLDEINNPLMPFIPPEDKKLSSHCPYCEYKMTCGTQWIDTYRFD